MDYLEGNTMKTSKTPAPAPCADDADDGARFGVCWDNGPATGEFGDYATEEEAEEAGEDWRFMMIAEDEDPEEAEEAYAFHTYRKTPPSTLDLTPEERAAARRADPNSLDGCDCGIYLDSGAPDFDVLARNCDCVTGEAARADILAHRSARSGAAVGEID